MKRIIQFCNRKLLKNEPAVDDCECVGNNKQKFPLSDKCYTENVLYKATETSDNCKLRYVESTRQPFKKKL